MAQYYQIVGQQTLTLEELRQYYPNITCVESAGGVQYVINNPEETQFEPQQVLLSSDQQIVLNSAENQQIIVDQSQISYNQQNQQYNVQENDIVTNYSQQQIYYTSTKQSPQTDQQLVNNSQRIAPQHVNQTQIRPNVTQQQISDVSLMGERRMTVGQNQSTSRPIALQYTLHQQQEQNQQPILSQDDNQFVVNDGRLMTLGQLKQELAQNQQENVQSIQPNCLEKQSYKNPPPKRNCKRTSNGRGIASSIVRGRNKAMPPNSNLNSKQFQLSGPMKSSPRVGGLQQAPRALQQQQQQQQQQQFQQSPNNRIQPLIPLSPLVHNGQIQQNATFSPQNSQVQFPDESNSSLNDEYKDSARMLVCLENGEQRLITFTLPREPCTVQDLLEQVGVPFNSDTKIECISNPCSEIDYVVTVGTVNNSPFQIDAQQVLTVDNLGDSQDCIVSQSGAVLPATEPPPQPQQPQQPTPSVEPPSEPERLPEPPKTLPKFVPGYLAVCNHCGYLSEDFNRCQRCKTKLPDDVKSISSKTDQKSTETDKKTGIKTTKTTTQPKIQLSITNNNTNAKSPAKNPRGKKKPTQDLEPVVLTLSSDEEDNIPKSSILGNKSIDNSVTLSAIQKEPIISEDCDTEIDQDFQEGIFGGGKDELLKTNISIYSTLLQCRTIRIGSYRFVPKEQITISSVGIKMFVPLITDPTQSYKLFIPIKYIIKILANFHRTLPVLFVYVTPSIGAMTRKFIKMEEGSEFYFDPLSKNESFKRITLLPENVTEEIKGKLKDIFLNTTYKMLEELTAKEANDILIRTCPREGIIKAPGPPVSFTEMRQLLIYPPGKGGIAINAEDYLCLAQDQFLNDVIIDFYLKYIVTDILEAPIQSKVYIFSSFFYKRLTTKPAKASKRSNPFEVDPNLTPAEKRHHRVKNWTKNVNIFDKDYIIIPINENSHWFLAIICFPGLEGCRSMLDSSKVVKIATKEKKNMSAITIGNTTITTLKSAADERIKPVEKLIKCDDDEGSDRDEADGDDSELEESENESELDEQQPERKSNQREAIKQPCILIFDSLVGASRSRVVATLRDYLTCEHRAKLSSNKTFNKDNIKGACPKVPQQMNFTDCGLYVLQYVESFFKDPITDYHIPIKMLKNWFEEITVTRKREEISHLIRELMTENDRDPTILPDIQFPTLNGQLTSNVDAHYDDGDGDGDGDIEDEDDEETTPHSSDKSENSLTQIQTMYHSDSSSESPTTQTNAAQSTTATFIVSNVDSAALKPDLSELQSKSNRDTMSYLKSKRIVRHRNQETHENKKQKIDE